MRNLLQALQVVDTTESLRNGKVILAINADVDGMHIRNLMITYFFKFFEHSSTTGTFMFWKRRCSAVLARGHQQQGATAPTAKPGATTRW